MWSPLFVLTLVALSSCSNAKNEGLGWHFVQNGTTGIVALESIVVSPSLILMFDRVLGDPLQINGHQAWGALWNTETNNVTAINVVTDTFCASGGFLSNGTMVCFRLLLLLIPIDVVIRLVWAVNTSSSRLMNRLPQIWTVPLVCESLNPAMILQVSAARYLKTQRLTISTNRGGILPL